MAMLPSEKQHIIDEYKTHDTDTGSSEVQIALLTARIKQLTEHVKIHKKDNHTRRGLLKLVGQRRRLLRYVKGQSEERYFTLIQKLGIRHQIQLPTKLVSPPMSWHGDQRRRSVFRLGAKPPHKLV